MSTSLIMRVFIPMSSLTIDISPFPAPSRGREEEVKVLIKLGTAHACNEISLASGHITLNHGRSTYLTVPGIHVLMNVNK